MATENEKRIEALKTDLVQKALAYGIAKTTYDRVWHDTYKLGQESMSPLAEAACRFANLSADALKEAAEALHDELLQQAKEEVANDVAEAKPVVRAVGEVDF